MARSKPRRNRRRNGKKPRSVALRSATTIPKRGLSGYSVMRSFSLYPSQWEQTVPSTWLKSLITFGSMAMKIFTTLIGSDLTASTWSITGAVQAFVLGPEDMAWSSPIREDKLVSASYQRGVGVVTKTAPALDYRQGRIQNLRLRISAGSELSRRAGRVCACVQPLTLDEADDARNGKVNVPTFQEVALMPGAVTAQHGSVLNLRYVAQRT